MRVLMITGDRRFGPGNPRYELQKSAVEQLNVVYWGRGSLWPIIPRGRFDIVTVQDPFWRGVFAWVVARRTGSTFNVQVHTDLSAQTSARYALAKIVLRNADSIRAVSEKVKAQVLKFGVRAKVTALPVFVDIKKYTSVVRRSHAQPTILWFGRFEEEKDPITAISVLEEVRRAGIHARLIMLGEGSMREQVVRRANSLPGIDILTWQNPILRLEEADVVLCTSKHESWGASIVEALAAGVPVVAPDVGVAREAGAIVVPREKLAGTVIDILQNPIPGTLKLELLGREEWLEKWKESLT